MKQGFTLQPGCWPTMITPFAPDGGIDYDAVRRLLDYFIHSHCAGVFAVCKSSEMFELTLQERVELGRAVVAHAGGRLGVIVSGHVTDDPLAQAEELLAMAQVGAQALVLVTNRMGPADGGDAAWIGHAERLLSKLPSAIPLGLYECPYPYPRLMSEAMLRFCADSSRFFFLKDTCCDEALILRRLALLSDGPLRVFNANSATLLPTLRAGAAGFCGVMANFHAELYAWLCAHTDDARAPLVAAGLSHLSNMERHSYPLNAKYHGQYIGIPMRVSTRQRYIPYPSETDLLMTRQMVPIEEALRQYVGLEEAL